MFRIARNGIIVMNRGDTGKFGFYVDHGTTACPDKRKLGDLDEVYLGIMEADQRFEDALVRKVFTKEDQADPDDEYLVSAVINPIDTIALEPGTY